MYTRAMTRTTPGAVFILADMSGSMTEETAMGATKAERLADILNDAITTLVMRSVKDDGVRDYLNLAVIGYNTDSEGKPNIGSAFGPWASPGLTKLSVVADNAKTIDREIQGANKLGERVTRQVKRRVWIEPTAEYGTPMCAALRHAQEILADWIKANPRSYPPIVLHITDGESGDGDPLAAATALTSLKTEDGNVLLFNCHLNGEDADPITYPDSDAAVSGNSFAQSLYAMSSVLPPPMVKLAQSYQIKATAQSRGFVYNADFHDLERFLALGTPVLQLS